MSTSQQSEMNDDQARSGVMCSQHVNSPTHIYFLDQNYRYKLVATHAPVDAGLAPIPKLAEKPSLTT